MWMRAHRDQPAMRPPRQLAPVLRKVDVRLPGKGNSNSHGARPVHLIITMIKWIRTSRLSIKNSLSIRRARSIFAKHVSLAPRLRKRRKKTRGSHDQNCTRKGLEINLFRSS